MKLLTFLICGLFITTTISASELDSKSAVEEMGFKLCHIRLHHQDLWRTLNIKIWYQLKTSESDTNAVKESVLKFLADYPNQADYWEILNKKMAHFLIETYPIESLEIELGVQPDAGIPVERRSVVRYQKGQLDELFGFKRDQEQNLSGALIEVSYKYQEGILPSEYPDFLWLCSSINQFLEEENVQTSSWESVKPRLMKFLMEKYPMVVCIDIDLKL